jgi:hypothetical protein
MPSPSQYRGFGIAKSASKPRDPDASFVGSGGVKPAKSGQVRVQ